jgi:hypothetical protein
MTDVAQRQLGANSSDLRNRGLFIGRIPFRRNAGDTVTPPRLRITLFSRAPFGD